MPPEFKMNIEPVLMNFLKILLQYFSYYRAAESGDLSSLRHGVAYELPWCVPCYFR